MRWVTTTTVIGIMCCTAITTTGDEDGSTEGKGKSAEGSLLPEIVVSAPKESLHVASTSGGTLIPVNVVELPMSVEVVPQPLLEDRFVSSFYDTLEQVSGVFSAGRSSFTVSSGKPTIRGFSGSDVMLDGLVLPARMPVFLDAEGIDGVEYYKGPLNSAQGGQSGLQGGGGAVNIKPKIADLSDSFQSASLGGQFGDGSSTRLTHDPNVLLTDNLALRMPFAALYERPYYVSSHSDVGHSVFVSPSMKWQMGPDTEVTLHASYQYSDKPSYQGIPYLKGDFLVPLDTYYGSGDTRTSYKGLTIHGRIDHRLAENLRLSLGGGYARADETRTHWSVNAGPPQGSGLSVLQYYDRISANRAAPFSYTEGEHLDETMSIFSHLGYDFALGPISNRLVLGVDWLERNTESRSRFGITREALPLLNPALVVPKLATGFNEADSKVDRYGVVLQDFASLDRWRLLIGTRVDRHESDWGNHADSISPRAGVTFLIEPDFAVYANVTRAEGPNFGFRDISGEELAESWRAEQVEAGVKKRLMGHLWGTLAGFQIRQREIPEVNPLDPSGLSYISNGENRSRGFEAAVNGELSDSWRWWGSYTYLEYEDVDSDMGFARFPRNSLTLWTSYRVPSGVLKELRAAAGYRYTGSYFTTFRGQFINDDYEIDPAHVVDLAFEYPLRWWSWGSAATRLEVGVKNIFDEEYVESNRHGAENFPGQPRTFWTRMSAKF